MSIETGLRTHLINNAAVSALVGSRVYPMRLPHGFTLPAISYQRISGPRQYDSIGATGRVHPRFQVDCWAETYAGVRDLANKVRLALNDHRGPLGGEPNVGSIELSADRDDFEEGTEFNRVILEFIIPYFEST